MKLITFRGDKSLKLGVKTDRGVLDLEKVLNNVQVNPLIPLTIGEFIEGEQGAKTALADFVHDILETDHENLFLSEDELQFGPCVPDPGKIICVGLNYRKHAEESNMFVPEYPILFNKFNNTVAAHEEVILLPAKSEQADYEAELVIVIGKKAKRVSKKEALDYVAGYCNGNDFSARDLQFRTSQWLLGKSCDGFCPLGPYLVTPDEVGDPNNLEIKTYVNGEIRQHSNTADMVFHCNEIISYISHYMTLEPGDIILTGTPEGVILGYPEEKQAWLKDGDEVTVEIEKLGRLTNQMKREF